MTKTDLASIRMRAIRVINAIDELRNESEFENVPETLSPVLVSDIRRSLKRIVAAIMESL